MKNSWRQAVTVQDSCTPLQIMLVVFIASICCNLWQVTEGTRGVDLSTSTSRSAFSCLMQQGYEFVIVRAYCSYGKPDSAAVGTITNANSAGFSNADVYMFPCPKCPKSASEQVQEMGKVVLTSVLSSY